MVEAIKALQDTVARLDSDVKNHAKTITVLVDDHRELRLMITQLMTDKAVRAERETNLHDRLQRIEDSIKDGKADTDKKIGSLLSIGKWILTAFGATLIAGVTNFIINGGLHIAS